MYRGGVMVARIALVLALAFSVFAQEENVGDVVDSMVYDKPAQWRIFSSGAPVKAFATNGSELWYATDEGTYSLSMKTGDVRQHPQLGSIPGTDVTSMITDGSNRVWIGTKNGVAMQDDRSVKSYTSENGLPNNGVNALLKTKNGVWVGTDGGAALYTGGKWEVFKAADGLAGEKVQALAVDKKGQVWFGTNKGISVYNGTQWTTHDMKNGLSWNNTKAIAIDSRKGKVWAAVGEKDVNCYDGKEWNTYMGIESDIADIMVDTQSRVWFGSPNGLLKFNGDEWISDPKKLGIPAAQVLAMHRDAQGNLWFGMESGVLQLENPYPY